MGSSLTFASPDYYQVLIDVTAGWAASLVNTRSPFTDWSNVSNVFFFKETTIPTWPHQELNPQPFD